MPQYDVSDPALLPLFELADWLDHVATQYETASGLFGSLSDLTPTHAIFRATETFGHDHAPDVRDYHRNLIGLDMVDPAADEVTIVADRDEALTCDGTAIWTKTDGTAVTYESDQTDDGTLALPKFVRVCEYVPFDTRVDTRDDLRAELDPVMDTTPDWESLFADTDSVGRDMMADM